MQVLVGEDLQYAVVLVVSADLDGVVVITVKDLPVGGFGRKENVVKVGKDCLIVRSTPPHTGTCSYIASCRGGWLPRCMATKTWELGYGYGTSGNWARYMLIAMFCNRATTDVLCPVQWRLT